MRTPAARDRRVVAAVADKLGGLESGLEVAGWHGRKSTTRAAAFLVAILAVAAFAGGCGSSEPTASPAERSRCVRVAPLVVSAIMEGLEPGLTLAGARAVRSTAYERVWFVSAEIQGPGFQDGDVATWSVNRLDDYGSIYSAGALAEEFSDWGPLPGGGGIGDAGYAESQECVS